MENKIKIDFEITGLKEAVEKANLLVKLAKEAQQTFNVMSGEEPEKEEPKMYKEIIIKTLEKQLELLSEHARDIPDEIYRCCLSKEVCRTAKALTEILSIPFSF